MADDTDETTVLNPALGAAGRAPPPPPQTKPRATSVFQAANPLRVAAPVNTDGQTPAPTTPVCPTPPTAPPRRPGLSISVPRASSTPSSEQSVEMAPKSHDAAAKPRRRSGASTPGGGRVGSSGKQRRTNNMKTFSALQSQGTSNKALPTVYVRSRRIRWKRAKRRAFFLLESGETSTKRTKLIRYLVIMAMLLSLAGVIFETMVVEFDGPSSAQVVRDLGMASELLGALVLLIDTAFRIWACTVDSRLPKSMFIIPHIFKTPERWCCSYAWQDPSDLVRVDDTGKPLDAEIGFRDDRPRPCGCKCRARVVYLFRPWSILELLTFIPIIIWVTSAGSTDVFALSQYGHGLRMLRLLRVVVLRRMFPGMRLLFKVIASKARELTSAFVMAVIVAVVLGAVVYELERPRAERTGFRTLFDGAYWSTITLSTVGYGDIVPLRFAGRVVTGVAIALLVGVFTLPAGVISSGFVELTDKTRVARRNAVIKFERVFRRLQGRSLMRRWHANTDASHGSRLARTHSAKVLRFRSSMRRIHIGGGGGDVAGESPMLTPTPTPGAPPLQRAQTDMYAGHIHSMAGSGLDAGRLSGDGSVRPGVPSPNRVRSSISSDGPVTLSRTEELRNVCMLDMELSESVAQMNRAQLTRLVSALGVLRTCSGNDALLFETLGRHMSATAQLVSSSDAY